MGSEYNGLAWAELFSPGWWAWSLRAGAFLYMATLLPALAMFAALGRFGTSLRDGGWALCRLLALIVPAWAAWFLASGPVPVKWALVAAAPLAVSLGASPWLFAREETADLFKRAWKGIAAGEAVLLVSFCLAIGLRAQTPAITWNVADFAAEKFTDMAIFAAAYKTKSFPPEDAWLAGEPINYYYFGHASRALWARALRIEPQVAYNLMLCLNQALATLLTFALVWHLCKRPGLGVLGAFLLTWGGNPKGAWQLWENLAMWRGAGDIGWGEAVGMVAPYYDMWAPSRAMNGTVILEFPAFSFWLGDLHAHTHGYLLVLGFLIWAAGLLAPEEASLDGPRTPRAVELIPGAFLLGAMGATNSWDLLACCFAAASLAWFAWGWGRGWLRGLFAVGVAAVAALAGTFLMFGPFWLKFSPPSQGGFPFKFLPDALRTPPGEFLLHWGFPLAAVAACLAAWSFQAFGRLARWASERPDGLWRVAAAGVWLVAGSLWIGSTAFAEPLDPSTGPQVKMGWVIAGLLAAMVLVPLAFGWRSARGRFAAGLLFAGLGLALLPEVIFLDDVFAGELERINTSFKFGYPTWPILGAGALAALALTGEEIRCWKWLRKGWARFVPAALEALVLGAWLAGALAYPVFATASRSHNGAPLREASGGPTLDGWAFAEAHGDDIRADYALIRRLAKEAAPEARPRTLEASDGTYSYASRFATNLGWAGLVGWTQHGASWRGGDAHEVISGREDMIATIYGHAQPQEIRDLLTSLSVQAVFWGALERKLYGEERRAALAEALAGWTAISDPSGRSTVWLRPKR